MKNRTTRIVSIFLTVLLLLPVLRPERLHASDISTYGSFSSSTGKFTWTLEDDVLTINVDSGIGSMRDFLATAGSYSDMRPPWMRYGYHTYITVGNISDGITHLGDHTFLDCTSLAEVSLPESLKTIGVGVFRNCTNLEQIVIPAGVHFTAYKMDDGTFESCTSLQELNLPDGLVSIPDYCARNCTSMALTTIPLSVSNIGSYAYDGCTSLKDVYYEGSKDDWDKISIASHNDPLLQANIHYNCFIDPETGRGSSFIDLSVNVHENQKASHRPQQNYRLSSGATITYDENDQETDGNGNLVFEYEGGDLTVSKEGYVSRTYDRAKLLNSSELYLQKESDYPVISGVWMRDFDIVNEPYCIDPESNISYTLTTEIDWGTSSEKTVKLVQKEKYLRVFSGTKTINWGSEFDLSEPIYIIATNSKGKTSRKQLQLELETAIPEPLDGMEFSLGDSIGFTIPDSIELFAGQEMDLGLQSPIPVEVVVDHGRFYVSIGVQFNAEREDGQWKRSKVKSICEQFKEAKESAAENASKASALIKKAKQNGAKATKGDLSVGIDASFLFSGYAEGYLDPDGNPVFTSSGIILNGNASASWTCPFTIAAMPAYFEVKLAGMIKGKLNLYNALTSDPSQTSKLTPEGELDWTYSLTLKGAAGVKKALSLGGGVTGSMVHEWDLQNGATDHFILKGRLQAFAFLSILDYTQTKRFKAIEGVWYEYPDQSKTGGPSLTEGLSTYDMTAYELQPLSDIQKVTNNITDTSSADSAWLENAYTNASPQIVTFKNGTRLAAWIGYDENRPDYDGLCLLTSYYDGSRWSDPMIVDHDGTMDAMPSLTLLDDEAYLLWSNASSSANEAESLEDMAKMIDVSLGTFNKSSQTFSITRITEGNGRPDQQPVLCGGGSTQYVVWLTNTENDWFGCNDANEIHCRTCTNGTWGEETTLYQGLSLIESMDADYSGSALHVAWSMDTDGDFSTVDDLEVYVDGQAYTDNTVCDSGVSYCWNKLFYLQDENLMRDQTVLIRGVPSDRYQVVEAKSDSYIVYALDNGLTSSLNAVVYDSTEGYWGFPIQLMECDHSILSFCAAPDGNDLLIMTNEADVDPEGPAYQNSRIMLYDQGPVYDLIVEDVSYDPYDNVLGNSMPFEVTIRNNGTESVSKVNMILENSAGEAVRTIPLSTFNYNDKSYHYSLTGEEDLLRFSVPLTDTILDDTMTLRVLPADGEDAAPDDNAVELSLAYQNVGLTNLGYGINEEDALCIYADVANDSYSDSGRFEAVLTDADGAELDRVAVSNVAPFTTEHICFTLADRTEGVFTITLEGMTADTQVADNADFLVILPQQEAEDDLYYVSDVYVDPTEAVLDLGETLQLHAIVEPSDAANQNVAWSSSDTSIVTVDENGLCTAVGAGGPVTITVTTEDGGYQASCEISVNQVTIPIDGIRLDLEDSFFTMCIGDSMQLRALILPEGTPTPELIWASDDEEIASVDENGLLTAGTKTGETCITVTYESDEGWFLYDLCWPTVLFRDVTDSSKYWFKPVYWAAEQGITNGYVKNRTDSKFGTFGAEENCTREQMITFLWRSAGSPEPKTTANPFSDVKKSAYYYKAVLWGYENGITKGYATGANKGKFGVGFTVTREDTVTFLYRLAKIELDPDLTKVTAENRDFYLQKFKDLRENKSKYYVDPIVWAADFGITKGYSSGPYKGNFGIGLNVLRKDIVTFIYRYDDTMK